LDLTEGLLLVRNKPRLGWQVKTRSERQIPLVPPLAESLRRMIGQRNTGALFRQRRCVEGTHIPPLQLCSLKDVEDEGRRRTELRAGEHCQTCNRAERGFVLRTIWRDLGAIREDEVRLEFIRLCRKISAANQTMPKVLRHGFATALQDANVDPLVRCQLMGHATSGAQRAGFGSLGTTAVYTHSRPDTVRRQLEAAMTVRPSLSVVLERLKFEPDGGRVRGAPQAAPESSTFCFGGYVRLPSPANPRNWPGSFT
jgi:hypothetical protein